MTWQVRSILDQRVEFVIRAVRGGESISSLCREYGISRPTGYLWRNRYREVGDINGLMDRSHRPKTIPSRTPLWMERNVIELRKKRGWGAKKLKLFLDEQGVVLPVSTLNRIIKRYGLISEKKPVPFAKKRFVRDNPNELWQMDFKGEYRTTKGICYPLTMLDDHSRFLIGLFALRDTQTETVHRCLVDRFTQFGLPEAMLTDHGSPWWSTKSEHGLTRLSLKLIKQGIKLYYSGVGHPQTQGKIERFHRTLNEEVRHYGAPKSMRGWQPLFDDIREIYNTERPHEALDMKVPEKKYKRSSRQYNPSPKEWEYPEGSNVQKVDASGSIRHDGKQLFVSHVLEGENIRVETLEDTIIASYQHMIVRQINKKTGVGTPILLPRNEL